jgi:hypothetical protein
MSRRVIKDKSIPPFVQIDIRLITALTNAEFKIYAQIKRRAGEDGECWQSLEHMASETGNSVSTLQRSLKTLKRLGLIAKTRRPGGTDVYELTPPEKWHLLSQNDRPNIGQNDLGVRSKRPEGFGQNDRPNIGQNDRLNRSPIEIDPIELDPLTYNAHEQSQNPESVCDKKNALDPWQDPELPKTRPTPISQATVNQTPTTSSAALDQGSAPRERESFSNYSSGLKSGAITTRRLSNWEKPQGEWWGRWRTGQGPGQWNEGFIDWMTTNWIQGKKRDRCAVIGYLVNCEADRTGAALQKLDGYFDSYELSWEAQTGHSADEKWLALASKLYENSKETEHCDAA